jgi:CRP/FNR family transcriptional regulator, dissimilatory nitrate respiration regulator
MYHLLQNQQIMPDYQILSGSPVFLGLTPEATEEIMHQIVFQVKRFQKDSLIASMGDRVSSLNIIQKGTVRAEMLDYSGRILKIEDIEAPRPLASAFLFGKNNLWPVTVTANSEVEIIAVPKEEFLKLMQKEQKILINYLNAISSRTQFLSNKLHFLSFRSIKGKIAQFLLQQAGSQFLSFELTITQQHLADLFGVTRPSLARVMGEMQREGIIRIEKKTIFLLDKQRLNQLLHHA